nr:hypothetical protein BaRGS_025127 [Batillaria attramentaria]
MWHVPVTLTSSREPDFDLTDHDVVWLDKTQSQKVFTPSIQLADSDDTDGWILANIQQYGYYRVNYDPQNWNALIKQLNKDHTV